jgi:hypothetical protein
MTGVSGARPESLTLILLVLVGSATPGVPGSLAAQSYLERTPHVDGGWVGVPGMLYMDDWALFRTTPAEGDGLLATPVYRALLSETSERPVLRSFDGHPRELI